MASDNDQGGQHTTNKPPAQPSIRVSSSRTAKARHVAKKWRYALLGVVGFGLLAGYLANAGHPSLKFVHRSAPISLTPPGAVRHSFQQRTQSRLHSLGNGVAGLSASQARLQHHIDALKAAQKKTRDENAANFAHVNKDMLSIQAHLRELASHATLPPPQPGPARLPVPSGAPPPPRRPGARGRTPPTYAPPGLRSPRSGAPLNEPGVPSVPEPVVITAPRLAVAKKVTTNLRYVKNPYAGYIPGGSFMPGVLLTGIEAGTATSAQSNPQPVLIRVQRNAILPGDARYAIASCFMIGSAYGSLSSQRAFIRLASISCVAKNKRLLLDSPIKGYAVDSDGMFGLRGKLIERRGALLAKTLLAGFASGLGNTLSRSQGTSYSGTGGSGTTLTGSAMLRSSLLTGAGAASNKLASFYLKEAEAIFPVIEVPPARKITVVVTAGQKLRWRRNTVLYVPHVTPTK